MLDSYCIICSKRAEGFYSYMYICSCKVEFRMVHIYCLLFCFDIEKENFGFCACRKKIQICNLKNFYKTIHGLITHTFIILFFLSIFIYFLIFILREFSSIFNFLDLKFFDFPPYNQINCQKTTSRYDMEIFIYSVLFLILLISCFIYNNFLQRFYYFLLFFKHYIIGLTISFEQFIYLITLPLIYHLIYKFIKWYIINNDIYYVNFKSYFVKAKLFDFHNIFAYNHFLVYIFISSVILSFLGKYCGPPIQIIFLLLISIYFMSSVLLKYYINNNYRNIHHNFLKRESWIVAEDPFEKFKFEKVY